MSTYGSEGDAMLWRDCSRNVSKAESFMVVEDLGPEMLWCARKDSRPELKAKEPSGRAESERSRRLWRDGLMESVEVLVARS